MARRRRDDGGVSLLERLEVGAIEPFEDVATSTHDRLPTLLVPNVFGEKARMVRFR